MYCKGFWGAETQGPFPSYTTVPNGCLEANRKRCYRAWGRADPWEPFSWLCHCTKLDFGQMGEVDGGYIYRSLERD